MKIKKTLMLLCMILMSNIGFGESTRDRYHHLASQLYGIRELDYNLGKNEGAPNHAADPESKGAKAAKLISKKFPNYRERINFLQEHFGEISSNLCNLDFGSSEREKLIEDMASFLRSKLPAEQLESSIEDLNQFFDYETVPEVCFECLGLFDNLSYIFAKLGSSIITDTIFYLNKSSHVDELTLTTIDNQEIVANYVPPVSKGLGVVILYHGNADIGKGWEKTAEYRFFRSLGLGVITPTIRGYSNSSSMEKQFNKSLLFDTEAVIHHLVSNEKIPLSKIVSYGFSLGGAYATTTAHYFRTPLILQNAWQNVQAIVSDFQAIVNEEYPSYQCFDFLNIFEHYENEDYFTCDDNLRAYLLLKYSCQELLQDFGNNVHKLSLEKAKHKLSLEKVKEGKPVREIRDIPIDVLILYTRKDNLMSGYKGALSLYDARYPSRGSIDQRLVGIDGDHMVRFGHSENAKKQVREFLIENKMINKTPSQSKN